MHSKDIPSKLRRMFFLKANWICNIFLLIKACNLITFIKSTIKLWSGEWKILRNLRKL